MKVICKLGILVAFAGIAACGSQKQTSSEQKDIGFRCCAEDAGWEEHGAHCVEAVTRIGGEYRAMELCEEFHGKCVSTGCKRK